MQKMSANQYTAKIEMEFANISSLVICRLRLEIFPALNRITNGHSDSAVTVAKHSIRFYWLWSLHTQSSNFSFNAMQCEAISMELFSQIESVKFSIFDWIVFTDRFTYLIWIVRCFHIRKTVPTVFSGIIIIYLLATTLYLIFVERVDWCDEIEGHEKWAKMHGQVGRWICWGKKASGIDFYFKRFRSERTKVYLMSLNKLK